jgi:streptogramin lyase
VHPGARAHLAIPRRRRTAVAIEQRLEYHRQQRRDRAHADPHTDVLRVREAHDDVAGAAVGCFTDHRAYYRAMAAVAEPLRSDRPSSHRARGKPRKRAALLLLLTTILASAATLAGAPGHDPARTWTFPSALETVEAAGGAIWLGEPKRRRLSRLDPTSGRITASVRADGVVRASGGELWLLDPVGRRLSELDPASGRAVRTVALQAPDGESYKGFDAVPSGEAVWIAGPAGALILDRDELRPRRRLTTPGRAIEPAMWAPSGDAVWMIRRDGTIERYDPASGRRTLRSAAVGAGIPQRLVTSDRDVVVLSGDGSVAALAPDTGEPRWRTRLPRAPGAATIAGDRLVIQAPHPIQAA